MTAPEPRPEEPEAHEEPAARPGRLRRLARGAFRWTRRIVVVALVLVLIARASMGLWLPKIVDAGAHRFGLHVTWEDLDLSILGASLDLTGLRVVALEDEDGARRDAEALRAAPPIAVLDDLGFDLDVSGLLSGARRIHRIEVGGLEAWVERDADGGWSFERFIPAPSDDPTDEEAADSEAADGTAGDAPARGTEADFTPPVELASLSVAGVRLHVVDRTCDFDTTLDLDALVRDLGHPVRPFRMTLSAAAEGVLDTIRVEGEGVVRGPRADLDLRARMAGLDVQRLAPYLALVGVRPEAERLDADLHAEVRMEGGADGTATGTVQLHGIEVRADGEVEAGVESIEAQIARFSPAALHVERVGVDGVRASAERLSDGTLRVAGLDLVGAPPGDADDEEEEQAADVEDVDSAAEPMRIAVDLVEVAPIDLRLRDAAVASLDGAATELALTVGARMADIVLGPGAGEVPITLDVQAAVEGAARVAVETRVTLPADDQTPMTARLRVRGRDVTLEVLRPYLAAAGIEPVMEDGLLAIDAQATVARTDDEGGLRIDAVLEGLRLTDGDVTLAELGAARVEGLELPASGDLRLETVGLDGLELPVTLTEGGGFRAFGFASLGAADAPAAREVGVERGALTVAGLDLGAESAQATIEGTLGLVQVADEVRLTGSIDTRSEPRELRAEVTVDANALVFEALTPILGPAGITPTMEGGRLTATARVHLRGEGADARIDASAESVALVGGDGAELIALDSAGLKDYALETGDAPQPGKFEIAGVRAHVQRRSDGVLVVAGLAFDGGTGPPAADDPDAAVEASAPKPPSAPGAGSEDEAPEAAGPPRAPLTSLSLSGVEIAWRDDALDEPVELDLTAEGSLDWTEAADTVDWGGRFALGVPGVIGELALEPRLTQRDGGLEADVTVSGQGINPGPAAAYAPPGVEILYEDGSLTARLTARIAASPDGGQSFEVEMTDLAVTPIAGGEPSLEAARFAASAPRIDAAAGVFEIAGVVSEGVVATIVETAEGDAVRLEAFGFALEAAPPAPPAVEPVGDVAESIDDDAPPPTDEVAPARSVSATGAPTVRLGRVDVGIDRLRYVDRTREDATPLDLRLHLTTPEEQTLMEPDVEELDPVRFALEGALEPLADELRVDLVTDLFSPTAQIELDVAVRGIDGAALERAAPDLAARVDLGAYQQGGFEAHAEASLQIPRRGETGFQFTRGLSGLIKVGPVLVRPTPDAEPTGFQELVGEISRLSPADGFLHFSSVDLGGIRGRVQRTAEGVTIAGVLIPTPPSPAPVYGPPAPPELGGPSADETVESDEPVEPGGSGTRVVSDGSAGRAAPRAARGGSEFRVDLLTIHGVDFEYHDTTVTPEFVFPIDDLSVEVQRFSSRTLEEDRPFTFRARLDAGEVQVPERTGADYLLFDIVGSAANAVTFAADEFDLEARRMWDLLEITGRLSFSPQLHGRVQTTVLGLELPAFQGLTASSGVDIGDGLIDSEVKVRFRDDGGLSIDSKTSATYLVVSEPPNGPISKYLALPAPLDTVLFLLRNDEGAQVLPVRLDIPAEGVSASRVARLATETIARLISDAVASAPLRVLGPLKDIAGPLGLTSAPPTGETVTLEFTAGAATVRAARRQGEGEAPVEQPLAVLADAMRRNGNLRVVVQAELGLGDIEVARRLGNPTPEVLEALLETKRARKAELDLLRARLSARVRAQLGVGATEEAERTAEELRLAAVERARVERAIDELFDRIRPGADRRAEARTRNAALALARERQERVRRRLLELAGPASARRIDVRRPRYVPPGEGDESSKLPELGIVTLTPR